jgi:hypothetical protein
VICIVKHPFWIVQFQIPQEGGGELVQLFDANDFENSATQHPTNYSLAGNGDVLVIVVHQNIRLSHVSVSDILNSDHVPIVFHILHLVTTYKLLEPFEQFTDWERFRSLVSNLISPRTEINSGVEANKAA